jgi:hypothetical protein
MKRAPLVLSLAFGLIVAAAAPASAQTLAELLAQLVAKGAVIAQPVQLDNFTRIDTTRPDLSTSFVPGVTLTTVPSALSAALALQLSDFPLGPTAGTLIYSRDGVGPEMHHMFGGAYADRALPFGRKKMGFSMTFQNNSFSTFDGIDLNGNGVNFLFANRGPSPDTSDVLQETVSFRLNRKVTSFVFNYGATDRLDVSVVAPIVQVAMDVRVQARIVRVRSSLDTLQSCAGVPARNTGLGPPLRLCQDPHGFDNTLTLGTQDTYLDLAIIPQTAFNNYGLQGKAAIGMGDIQFRSKYALVTRPTTALAATIDLSLPTGDSANFLGTGAVRGTPGVVFSTEFGRLAPHVSAGYTFSHGSLSSRLQSGPVPLDLTVPNEVSWAAGVDAAVAPRTTLVADFIGRTVKNVQRFATGTTIFGTGAPGVPVDVAAGTDLIRNGTSNISQSFGIIGARFNLSGPFFANGSVMFPIAVDGLKPRKAAVFSIDYLYK